MSLHGLEFLIEVGSQVQPLSLRGREERRAPERLFDVVRVVEFEAMIDVSGQRCTDEADRISLLLQQYTNNNVEQQN